MSRSYRASKPHTHDKPVRQQNKRPSIAGSRRDSYHGSTGGKKNRGGDTRTRERRSERKGIRQMNKTKLSKGMEPVKPEPYREGFGRFAQSGGKLEW